ncbi:MULTISPECIES: PLP-dependent cysteine synthase family protein [unclassified Pseudoclavibacter]|uniref:PLP-dependent cysteine synthase family protein n=1 Tax=unclassified Pseudoclavibacter TaxID=2615177 RepID=UPI0013010893|nr:MULTISPECIES: cysteine synthase family protein [unclassified Pseudoclavibacter]KAB1644476.1 cysteine synthase family protein [Pseudoclavibacter sp. CFCC 14310]KAB1664020.1 cysteine synthase family protein [Pseudoclavibacter sp. CFCC 13611]
MPERPGPAAVDAADRIRGSILELIGDTPLVELSRYRGLHGLGGRLLAKLERANPAGSAKDRIALSMIEDAERRGDLSPGDTIVELTSGNTGIGIAAVGAVKGYRVKIVMGSAVSAERARLVRAYGAEVVILDEDEFATGPARRDEADRIAAETERGVQLIQSRNPANPAAHRRTTGPEIWRDTAGQVDALVASAGTGGTLSGTASFLREHNPDLHVVLVEPTWESVPTPEHTHPSHRIDGVHRISGEDEETLPWTLDRDLVDESIEVAVDDAYAAARELGAHEGILVGTSSGAALWAAAQLAGQERFRGRTVVVILPDTGERYLSTPLFD